jgi:hypothetical protein
MHSRQLARRGADVDRAATDVAGAYNHHQIHWETNPAVWMEDFRLACRAGGANNDYFIIQYLPICVGEFVRAWLEFLPPNSIRSWAELKQVFVENFQGTYMLPENS